MPIFAPKSTLRCSSYPGARHLEKEDNRRPVTSFLDPAATSRGFPGDISPFLRPGNGQKFALSGIVSCARTFLTGYKLGPRATLGLRDARQRCMYVITRAFQPRRVISFIVFSFFTHKQLLFLHCSGRDAFQGKRRAVFSPRTLCNPTSLHSYEKLIRQLYTLTLKVSYKILYL